MSGSIVISLNEEKEEHNLNEEKFVSRVKRGLCEPVSCSTCASLLMVPLCPFILCTFYVIFVCTFIFLLIVLVVLELS